MSALGRVQRVDGPSPQLIVLSLYDHALGRRILLFSSVSRRTEWAAERPKGEPADGFVRRLRKLLVGGTVDSLEARGGRTRVGILLRDRRVWLTDDEGAPVVREEDGRPLAGRRRFAQRAFEDGWEPTEPEGVGQRAEKSDPDQVRRKALRSRLVAHRKRLDKKIAAIDRDARRADRVGELRLEAELITAHLHAWDGGPSLTVLDWTLEPPSEKTLTIDPRLGARGQAEKLFAQARRFQRGATIAAERGNDARGRRLELLSLLASLDAGEVEIAGLEAAIAQLGIRAKQPPPGRKREQARLPHRTFVSSNDQPIWVGRGPADNDALTLAAKPHFHWLHARGMRGAHVVVPLSKGHEIASDILLDAATLAAHFSGARTEARVEVQHTARRHVRKPRNAAPGLVLVSREKVLLVRMEGDRLERLLASERR